MCIIYERAQISPLYKDGHRWRHLFLIAMKLSMNYWDMKILKGSFTFNNHFIIDENKNKKDSNGKILWVIIWNEF